jgi:hypothetical protein
VYQGVKYMTKGTPTSANVVIAGNVRIRAGRERIIVSRRAPARGNTAMASEIGRPSARNSGTTRTSSTVCTARTQNSTGW